MCASGRRLETRAPFEFIANDEIGVYPPASMTVMISDGSSLGEQLEQSVPLELHSDQGRIL